ncbi:MAG: hypothetical protein QXW98_04710 [Candidatus Caldarchaeum sp.]
MSEETPLTRLKKLTELLEKLPDDISILMELSENDPEIKQQLAAILMKMMNIPYKIQTEVAKKLWQMTNR